MKDVKGYAAHARAALLQKTNPTSATKSGPKLIVPIVTNKAYHPDAVAAVTSEIAARLKKLGG